MTRSILYLSGRPFVFASEHPLEERIFWLTDDYKLSDGSFLLPELLGWDGVVTEDPVLEAGADV